MIKLSNLSLRQGAKLLLQDVNLVIYSGQKVGITGANGVGKSSLLALLRKKIQADAGDCELPANWAVAYATQQTSIVNKAAIEYVLDGDIELRKVETAITLAEKNNNGEKVALLYGQLDAIDGYQARSRAATLMHGLGFGHGQESMPVDELSGGWRMRLNLAQALMCRSDLLLLDEPTNHLDLDAVLWVEDWLRAYSGTLLLVSHDRDFLDNVTSHIAHIEHRKMTLYTGNYSAFEEQRTERLAQQQAGYEKQQREFLHIKKFIDRFRAKATKARQAQSRLKALDRVQKISVAHVDSEFQFTFRQPEKVPNPLLSLNAVDAGYKSNTVLRSVELSLRPGDRMGVLGPNGAGKSTLIKLLAGKLLPQAGNRAAAADLKICYFAQHQIEQLDLSASPLLHLQRIDPKASDQELRNFLGGFAFHGDTVFEPVEPFSGGEKARLVLSLLVYQKPNLLLLDEPTNHLDLDMRHALTVALQAYVGALILISHDRYLLNSTTDGFWLVANNEVKEFDGDLDDYRRWLQLQRTQSSQQTLDKSTTVAKMTKKQQRQKNAEMRKQQRVLSGKVKNIERQIESLTKEKSDVENQLANADLYGEENKSILKQAMASQTSISHQLLKAEEQWLEIHSALEKF